MLSITIRPREENFDLKWKQLLISYFDKKKYKYVIGVEQGNHLQIALETKVRSNNLRRSIIKELNYTPEDDDESRVWLNLKNHSEPCYLIGYCCKDLQYVTNYSNEYIEECVSFYENKSDTLTRVKTQQKWVCTGMNTLLPCVYEYAVKNHMLYKKLRVIITMMLAEDLIPLSLARKIDSKMQDFWIGYRGVKTGRCRQTIITELENYYLE